MYPSRTLEKLLSVLRDGGGLVVGVKGCVAEILCPRTMKEILERIIGSHHVCIAHAVSVQVVGEIRQEIGIFLQQWMSERIGKRIERSTERMKEQTVDKIREMTMDIHHQEHSKRSGHGQTSVPVPHVAKEALDLIREIRQQRISERLVVDL